MEKLSELVKLRVSVARIAQMREIDNELCITGKNYDDLIRLAQTQERGWNHLAGLVYDEFYQGERRKRETLVDLVLAQIVQDVQQDGDITAVEELIKNIPDEQLKAYLPHGESK